jgi:hypothetical protein
MAAEGPTSTSEVIQIPSRYASRRVFLLRLAPGPQDGIRELAKSDVVLRRRGASALRLTQAYRDEDFAAAFEAMARVLQSLAAHHPEAMREAALDAFSWVSFLPPMDRGRFLSEFTRALLGAAELDIYAPVSQLLVEWRATAEVHGDPRLARRLAALVAADGESVPEPSS